MTEPTQPEPGVPGFWDHEETRCEEDRVVDITLYDAQGRARVHHRCRTTQEQAEAELLRSGVEMLVRDPPGDAEKLCDDLQRLLDDVDAEDSLHYVVKLQALQAEVKRLRYASAVALDALDPHRQRAVMVMIEEKYESG